jgi:broad specificity phosphatase PhoE
MKQTLFLLLVTLCMSFFFGITNAAHAQTIYIVRHAEKLTDTTQMDMMSRNDPPLTREGYQRAEALAGYLKKKNIGYIFVTPYSRTRSTALPTADLTKTKIDFYGPSVDMSFIQKIRSLDKDVLVVGHSNTVDDLVNQLMGQTLLTDLSDKEYDRIFIVQRNKKGEWVWEDKTMTGLKIMQ